MRPMWLLPILAIVATMLLYFSPATVQQLRRLLPGSAPALTTDHLYRWKNPAGEWQVTDTPPPAGVTYEPLVYRSDTNVLPVPPGIAPAP